MSDGLKVVALKSFVYGPPGEAWVRERGEIFSMIGGPHDYTMLGKGRHVREAEESELKGEFKCDCGSVFAYRMGYEMHLTGRIHPQSPNYAHNGRTHRDGPTAREVDSEFLPAVSSGERLSQKEIPIIGG